MNCEQAKQLFDAYLDGELSTSLATELGAHRLRCSNCRRALALLEVSGHIIGSDREAGTLPEAFSDRLLSCVDDQNRRAWVRFRRTLYIAGPVAAAAVVVLAFAGLFDGQGKSTVAGKTEIKQQPSGTGDQLGSSTGANEQELGEHALSDFIEQAQRNMEDKRRSGESLQQMLDQTIFGALDQLEEEGATPRLSGPPREAEVPDAEAPAEQDSPGSRTRPEEKPSKTGGVENL